MITSLHDIELTSRCNLRCHYCPQPTMARAKVDMTDEIFERCLYWLKEFRQQYVHLHNFGEPTLDPKLVERVEAVRQIVPEPILCTNGVGVTRELVRQLKWAGLARMDVSIHRPEVAQWAVSYAKEVGLNSMLAIGPAANTHDWAGQVKGKAPVTVNQGEFDCQFLRYQRAVALSDGSVAACCIDAEGQSARPAPPTVFDDLRKLSFRPFELCRSCHHVIGPELFGDWKSELEADPARPAVVWLQEVVPA